MSKFNIKNTELEESYQTKKNWNNKSLILFNMRSYKPKHI